MNTHSHPLFEQYPLNGKQEISVGPVPIPYHTYDGHGILIGGTVDLAAGDILVEGQVRDAKQASPRVGWSLLRLLGLRQTIRAFKQPYLAAKVVNPIGAVLPYNADAPSFLAADAPILQWFDPATDNIRFHPNYAQQFDFQPQFVEHFAPFRFVYLHPEKA